MSGMQFDITVRELLDTPARTSVQSGLFRTSGRGVLFQKNSFTQLNAAAARVISFPGKELILISDRVLTVLVTPTTGLAITVTVNSFLILTLNYTAISITYTNGTAATTDVANITLFQS